MLRPIPPGNDYFATAQGIAQVFEAAGKHYVKLRASRLVCRGPRMSGYVTGEWEHVGAYKTRARALAQIEALTETSTTEVRA